MPAPPLVPRARRARPVGSTGLGSDFRPTLLVTAAVSIARPRSIPLGRLMQLPTPPPNAFALHQHHCGVHHVRPQQEIATIATTPPSHSACLAPGPNRRP